MEVFKFIKGDKVMLERQPLQNLQEKKQLVAYRHKGFWQCMDTLREKILLEKLFKEKKAPWIN